MPRPEKVQAVADIKERIEGAQAVFLAEYAGLSVKDQQALRRSLRENGAEFKVVKMSMARLAAAELDIDTLDELLLGPTGLAFADGDPAGAAKVLKDFARSHDTFAVKGGLLGLEFLPPEKIAELAELEPRDVLLAKLAGVMQAPMANLAGLLAALPRNTASVLQQLLEKKEAAEGQSAAGSDQPSAEDTDGEEPTADGAEETEEADAAPEEEASEQADAAPEEEASEEAAEAADAGADTDAVGGAPKADEADDATAETDTTDEASDDAGDESDDQADEASEEDAEEE